MCKEEAYASDCFRRLSFARCIRNGTTTVDSSLDAPCLTTLLTRRMLGPSVHAENAILGTRFWQYPNTNVRLCYFRKALYNFITVLLRYSVSTVFTFLYQNTLSVVLRLRRHYWAFITLLLRIRVLVALQAKVRSSI